MSQSARPSQPTSVSDFTNPLLEEWSKTTINTLLNLVESLPRIYEAVIAPKAGLTSYYTLWIKNRMSIKFICVKGGEPILWAL